MSWLEENIKEELMEVAECTKIVLDRLQQFETENVNKIFGYLLLRRSHEEIIHYAHGSDNMILSLIDEAKSFIEMASKSRPASINPLQCMPSPGPFSSPSNFRAPGHQNFDPPLPCYTDFGEELVSLENQSQYLSLPGSDYYYYPDGTMGGSLVYPRNIIQSPNGGIEIPQRVCPYFYKGMCKHGINCRNLHGRTSPDSFYIPNMNELANDDHTFVAGSLEKLELEITELLRSRRGIPVSIASLPMIYHEMYGKTLQAEGYLTESQRHGKAGFNLTKLLARLKNSIQLIDRPHGQHSVVLAEDAAKYMEHRNERCDSGVILGSSHQIYLTFPAESTFSEDEVYKYFRHFGPVHDVRIPRQEKRMFGFVSFWYPETVKLILEKGHPHYICGARVLVKPYKEKSRIADKKYTEKIEIPMCYSPQYYELDHDPNSFPRLCGNSRILEKQLQDYEHFLELERRRLFRLRLTPEPPSPQSYFGYGLDELKHPQDRSAPSPAWNNCSTNDEKTTPTIDSNVDQDSGHIELPDSPFASPRVESNVSTTL